MKKNGFTLIELLGVIIILALLMIVVFPSVINSIKSTSDSTEEQTEKLIKNAAKLYINDNSNKYIKSEKNTYCIPINDLIESGKLDSQIIETSENITSDYIVEAKYSNTDKDFVYNISSTCDEYYVCNLTTDVDNDKEFDVGDEITCGTESFYVISDDGDTIQMLAKYRINLEKGIQNTSTQSADEYEGTTLTTFGESNCVLNFSSTVYWFDENGEYLSKYRPGTSGNYYVFDKNEAQNCTDCVIYYVVQYGEKLKGMGVMTATSKLMSFEQATGLGCVYEHDFSSGKFGTCGPEIEGHASKLENPAPNWVYDSTYWLGSKSQMTTKERIWSIDADGSFDQPLYQESNPNHGVRPVITISKNEIKISEKE